MIKQSNKLYHLPSTFILKKGPIKGTKFVLCMACKDMN